VRLGRRVAAALALAALAPGPAAAHGPVPDAAYYRTALGDGHGLPAGVTAAVDPAGEWVQLAYTGPAEVVVLGYTREPYLRITAHGVAENLRSPATCLNRAGFADIPSGTQDATVVPEWHEIAAVGVARWHDHRIHWMGQDRPPQVAADPTHAHLVQTWTVHATAAGAPFDIAGTLTWVGKPESRLSTTTWALLVLANVPFVAAAVVVTARGQRRRRTAGPTDP
jgi:hypothetical protein